MKTHPDPGTTNRLNRRNFNGTKVAQKGDYDLAKQLGHLPALLLHEVTGALHPLCTPSRASSAPPDLRQIAETEGRQTLSVPRARDAK